MIKNKKFGLWIIGAFLLFFVMNTLKNGMYLNPNQPFDHPFAFRWGMFIRMLLDIIYGLYLGLLVVKSSKVKLNKYVLGFVTLPSLLVVFYQYLFFLGVVPLFTSALGQDSYFEIVLGISLVIGIFNSEKK